MNSESIFNNRTSQNDDEYEDVGDSTFFLLNGVNYDPYKDESEINLYEDDFDENDIDTNKSKKKIKKRKKRPKKSAKKVSDLPNNQNDDNDNNRADLCVDILREKRIATIHSPISKSVPTKLDFKTIHVESVLNTLKSPEMSKGVVESTVAQISSKHTSILLEKQLEKALKKLDNYSKENSILVKKMDDTNINTEFSKLHHKLHIQSIELQKLQKEKSALLLINRNQEKQLLEAQRISDNKKDEYIVNYNECHIKQVHERFLKLQKEHTLIRQNNRLLSFENSEVKTQNQKLKELLLIKLESHFTKLLQLEDEDIPLLTEENKNTIPSTTTNNNDITTSTSSSSASNSQTSSAMMTPESEQTLSNNNNNNEILQDSKPPIFNLKAKYYALKQENINCHKEIETLHTSVKSLKFSNKNEIQLLKNEILKYQIENDELKSLLATSEKQARNQLLVVKQLKRTCEELADGNKHLLLANDTMTTTSTIATTTTTPPIIPSKTIHTHPQPPTAAKPSTSTGNTSTPLVRKHVIHPSSRPKAAVLTMYDDDNDHDNFTNDNDIDFTFITTQS